MMGDHRLDLECDPAVVRPFLLSLLMVKLFQRVVGDEELRSGRPSSRRQLVGKDITPGDALRDPATRDLYINALRQLRELTNVFMLTIENNVTKIPFGIRYVAREIYTTIKVWHS